ncbi:MAG TPA: CRTAC1 family protein [Terriglobales bacterium]
MRSPTHIHPAFGFSRRRFLQGLASSVLFGRAARGLAALSNFTYPFEEVPASASGISWVHTAGKSAEKYLPETTGAGCAIFDYDNDGWMDIYLVNSGKCDFYNPAKPLRNALYRNNRDGTFADVTEKAGVPGGGYGMGIAVGDYDGDGFPDLYVSQYGRSILYHNNGNGTFTDVTDKAGVAAAGWATSGVWFDYDNDGKLDLFVGRFADVSKAKSVVCGDANRRRYCLPTVFQPMASWLFRNNGDGTFTDVSKESGIANSLGKAWGVVAADINNDGRMDLFVANDTVANFLFANRGGGRFEEIGLQADVAYSAEGRARSGMGVDSADFNDDGWMDLFVANLNEEVFSLYQNSGEERFDDQAMPLGIGMPTRSMSGWGLKFFDYDNDGNLDLILANGHPDDHVEEIYSGVKYQEPLLLFQNTGGRFKNVSPDSGPVFAKSFAARGLAVGDINNDGAVDVLINVNDGAPVLLRNNVGKENHWLGVHLVGKKSNPDAIGARVSYQAGDMQRNRMKVGGGSFLSSHDPRMVLGIGQRKKMDWVEVKWPQPGGGVERFTDLPIDRYVRIVEGAGKWQ